MEKTFEKYREEAEQGNTEAQLQLALCYNRDWLEYLSSQMIKEQLSLVEKVKKNEEQSLHWFKKAAEQGNAVAQCGMGFCYEFGAGVLKNENHAVDWYRKAAEQGNTTGQCELGLCYEKGKGIAKDEFQAVEWYKKAAEQGYSGAQLRLGLCYLRGMGIAKDEKQFIYWYKKAAEQGGAFAQWDLGNCYKNGVGIAKDESQAVYWYKKAAEQGYAAAQWDLGSCYEDGKGVKRDYVQAAYWCEKATKQENKTYRDKLASFYWWNFNDNLRYDLAKCYLEKGENENALFKCNELINKIKRTLTEFDYGIYELRGDVYINITEYENARKDYLTASGTTNENKLRILEKKLEDVGKILQNKYEEDGKIYQKQLEEYTQSFLKQPYHKRKLMVPIDKVHNPLQRSLSVLDINHLPDGIYFQPGGYPVNRRLYICHPYIDHTYIPFQDYELEFVDEKLREFCYLMQCIGATEVTIESINGKSKSDYLKKTKLGSESSDFQGKGKTPMTSGSVDVEKTTNYYRENESSMDESLTRFFAQSQTFKPKDFPYIPEKLVWYPNEPSWIRLVEQRIQGSLLEHRERIGTKKSRMVEQTEISQIQEELNIAVEASAKLFSGSGKLNTSNSTNTENKIKLGLTEDVELSIYVKFASIDTFRNDNSVVDAIELKSIAPSTYSKEELEYLDELKSCLSESNEIPPKEKRLLAKLRDTLGISEERTLEIGNSLIISQFAENEKEYIEELKACFEEDNKISEKERRLLNKIRIGLKISEERASEIEAFIKKHN